MDRTPLDLFTHDHRFGQHLPRPGEARTRLVVAITVATMVIEIAAGIAFGSMALLADGLHMASHAAALGLSTLAYVYARRHADDSRFSFGTGKVNALAGFTGAVLLAGFALFMAIESLGRFVDPVAIEYDYAIAVAVLGLLVNGASVLILGGHGHDHGHDHHDHHHDHDHHHHAHHHEDHNLRSAYLHVLADALTSLLAIAALLSGRFLGLDWLDPVMGIVGALLVANWSVGLLRQTARVLLDRQAPAETVEVLRNAIERDGDRVTDLHVWSIGPGIHAAVVAVVSDAPLSPEVYKQRIPSDLGIVHASVEVHAATD